METGSYSCKWSGRRLIEFSLSGPTPFVQALRATSMEQDRAALAALRGFRDVGGDADSVLEGFHTAKRMLEARFKQYTSFLSQTPWNLVGLLGYLLPSDDVNIATLRSRQLAMKLLREYDSGHLGEVGDVGRPFLHIQGRYRNALERWGRGIDLYMNQQLFRQLVAYSTSLLVMQRLEAKHHLIHVSLLNLQNFSLQLLFFWVCVCVLPCNVFYDTPMFQVQFSNDQIRIRIRVQYELTEIHFHRAYQYQFNQFFWIYCWTLPSIFHIPYQVRVSISRALGVAHMSANLRRALHDDLEQESFRSNMNRYLDSFHELVEDDWATFRELQSFTSGHKLEIMFADRTADNAAILSALPEDQASQVGSRERLAHFMNVTRKSGYYAIPTSQQSNPASTTYMCFQVLGFKPGHRKYMQRLTQWSIDEWKGALSCAVLGTVDVPKTNMDDEEGNADQLATLPNATNFKSRSSIVQPVPLDEFFSNDNIDYLHEFKHVVHQTEFDETAVHDSAAIPIDEDGSVDEDLANLNFKTLAWCHHLTLLLTTLKVSRLSSLMPVWFPSARHATHGTQ